MTGTLWAIVALLGLLASAGATLFRLGRKQAAASRDAAQAKSYETTMEAATDAPVHTDPAAARERMRTRDPRKP